MAGAGDGRRRRQRAAAHVALVALALLHFHDAGAADAASAREGQLQAGSDARVQDVIRLWGFNLPGGAAHAHKHQPALPFHPRASRPGRGHHISTEDVLGPHDEAAAAMPPGAACCGRAALQGDGAGPRHRLLHELHCEVRCMSYSAE